MLYLAKARILADRLRARLSREEGQGMVEYGLIVAAIAVVCIGAFQLLGGNIVGLINGIAGDLIP